MLNENADNFKGFLYNFTPLQFLSSYIFSQLLSSRLDGIEIFSDPFDPPIKSAQSPLDIFRDLCQMRAPFSFGKPMSAS